MSNVEKISIALPKEMALLLHKAVETGDYASVSEVIREALRDWKLRHQVRQIELDELRQLWREGVESGPVRDGIAVLDRLRDKYHSMPDKKAKE